MNRQFFSPGNLTLKATSLTFTTDTAANGGSFAVNGNPIPQTTNNNVVNGTPALDVGSITTMNVRGGAAVPPGPLVPTISIQQSTGNPNLPTTVRLAVQEFRVITNAGLPTQLFASSTALMPVAMRPNYNTEKVVNFINAGLPVSARALLSLSGILSFNLMSGAFTAPFGLDGDFDMEYIQI